MRVVFRVPAYARLRPRTLERTVENNMNAMNEPRAKYVTSGYWAAVLLPVLGVVLAVMLGARKSHHAPWVLVLSLLSQVVWLAVTGVI